MKKAIVIGASSGIGREVTRLLIREGWTVGAAARREERLKELGAAAIEKIDVTQEDAPARLRTLIGHIGGMDLFFYASGIGKQNRELEEGIELATMQTNAMGFTRMIGEAYRYFAEQGRGHIAAITSIAGTKGLGPAPSYSATKAMQNVYLQALEQQANSRGLKRLRRYRPARRRLPLSDDAQARERGQGYPFRHPPPQAHTGHRLEIPSADQPMEKDSTMPLATSADIKITYYYICILAPP